MSSDFAQLREVDFHGAVIGDVVLSVADRSCSVSTKLEGAIQAPDQLHTLCLFNDVRSCFARLDFTTLLAESWAGNVQNCRVNVEGGTARLYLSGGLLECSSRTVLLVKQESVESPISIQGGVAKSDPFSNLGARSFDESRLIDLTLSPDRASCTIRALVRGGSGRGPMVHESLCFEEVSSCLAMLDMSSLSNQTQLGNVQSLQLDAEQGIARLYLRDGLIEIACRSVATSRR
jgi:hypothetical protein